MPNWKIEHSHVCDCEICGGDFWSHADQGCVYPDAYPCPRADVAFSSGEKLSYFRDQDQEQDQETYLL